MKTFILFSFVAISLTTKAQTHTSILSPDKNIRFTLSVAKGKLSYEVAYKGKLLIARSQLHLTFLDGSELGENTKQGKSVAGSGVEDYELVTGKTKLVHQPYTEVTIPLSEVGVTRKSINIVVRAFNDGVAFRYEFPQQAGWSQLLLKDENSSFNLVGDPLVRALFLPNYTSSHEGLYTLQPLSQVKNDTLMDMPVLFEFDHSIYMAITEANLFDYAGMYLSNHNDTLRSRLSPWPGQPDLLVKADLPHHSPWRVMMISDRAGALIESDILTSLSEPCKIKDVSWIKPGKTTFPWWNGNVVPDTINAPGNNFVTNQYYIDFCARNGLEYHSVVEYGLHQWYTDDGVGFQPGPHSDVTTPVPGLDMKDICDYAATKGVGVRVWVHWAALYPKLDTAFAVFEKWGLKGMMVDFMDRDDQQMVNMQTEMLQKAALHHLHIQFHGAYKPTGETRTYPNEFTREGTLNYEVNKWDKKITPDHDLDVAFTRLIAGPTDYHLGGFRAVPDSLFRVQYTRPLMLGTRCHMLAMYVVLQNPLGMVCDYPEAYEGQPGFEFIKEVPTNWDETRVPAGKPGEYLAVAREKDGGWYLGCINNHAARDLSIPLDFLGDGSYEAEIFADGDDASVHPNNIKKEKHQVKKTDKLTVHLAAGGGVAISFKKTNF